MTIKLRDIENLLVEGRLEIFMTIDFEKFCDFWEEDMEWESRSELMDDLEEWIRDDFFQELSWIVRHDHHIPQEMLDIKITINEDVYNFDSWDGKFYYQDW